MIISIIGQTDRRPVLYTLMKVCQKLGDTAVISDDRHLKRLIGNEEMPYYQNILVDITDESVDEWMETTDYNVNDFEYIITDGKLAGQADIVIYCKGYISTEDELDELEYLDDYIEIGFGRESKSHNHYSFPSDAYSKLERIESYKQLIQIDSRLTSMLGKLVSPRMGINQTQFVKAVSSR